MCPPAVSGRQLSTEQNTGDGKAAPWAEEGRRTAGYNLHIHIITHSWWWSWRLGHLLGNGSVLTCLPLCVLYSPWCVAPLVSLLPHPRSSRWQWLEVSTAFRWMFKIIGEDHLWRICWSENCIFSVCEGFWGAPIQIQLGQTRLNPRRPRSKWGKRGSRWFWKIKEYFKNHATHVPHFETSLEV